MNEWWKYDWKMNFHIFFLYDWLNKQKVLMFIFLLCNFANGITYIPNDIGTWHLKNE